MASVGSKYDIVVTPKTIAIMHIRLLRFFRKTENVTYSFLLLLLSSTKALLLDLFRLEGKVRKTMKSPIAKKTPKAKKTSMTESRIFISNEPIIGPIIIPKL